MSFLLENRETIEQQARLFDDVRPPGARLFLLKRIEGGGEEGAELETVSEIEAGWFASFDKEFREDLKVSIATLSADFGDLIAQSSFLGYGSDLALDVYSFAEKDATGPNATSPSWKIVARRDPLERFTVIGSPPDPAG